MRQHRKWHRHAAVLGVLALAGCNGGNGGLITPTPIPNKIIFVSERDGNPEIYIMSADGSGQTRLTRNETSDAQPAFSPDGSRIAFTSDRQFFIGNPGLFIMNADGTNVIPLFDTSSAAKSNGDAHQNTRVEIPGHQDFQPSFSPNGNRIVFASNRANRNDPSNLEIYLINTAGTNLTRLTNNSEVDTFPIFNPTGDKIVFQRMQDIYMSCYAVRI